MTYERTFHRGGECAERGGVVAGGEDKTVRLSLWRKWPAGVFHPRGVLVVIRPRITVPGEGGVHTGNTGNTGNTTVC